MSDTRLIERAVIRLTASDTSKSIDDRDDVRTFLQGLVSQDMALVQADAPQWSALLSAQGKLLFDFFLWADGSDILIDCDAQSAQALENRLKIYRLRRKIDIAIDKNISVHWAIDSAGHPKDPRLAELGHRWLESASDGESADARYLAHRLSHGVAEGPNELGTDKILWLECNAAELNGVSFTKGCYVGQENTARMNYRQKVNRRIVVVPLAQANEKRQTFAYDALGYSIEHRRIDDLTGIDLPHWQDAAL